MTDRFVVYFQPALENIGGMDTSLSSRLTAQIESFLSAWKPEAAFEKQLQGELYQFKYSPRRGSGARAFSGHFRSDDHDIALVLTAYKKGNEAKFLAKQTAYDEKSGQLNRVLAEKTAAEIDAWIRTQRHRDDRRVVDETDLDTG